MNESGEAKAKANGVSDWAMESKQLVSKDSIELWAHATIVAVLRMVTGDQSCQGNDSCLGAVSANLCPTSSN
jgi:hypothetical protein